MKNENGAIVIYVSVACLFLVIVGIASFISLSNKQSTQLDQLKQIEDAYDTKTSMEEEYKTYNGGEIIPINTSEQALKIGSNEEIYISGKIYTLGLDNTYIIKNDIKINGDFTKTANIIKNNNILIHGNGNIIEVTTASGQKEYYTEDTNYSEPQTSISE